MKNAKLDPTVRRETLYIGAMVLILSALMEAVFLILQKWDITVLFGNLLGGGVATLNFFLMGLTVQSAVGREEKEIVTRVRLSQSLRLVMLFLCAVLAFFLPCFHLIATLIPFVFPRIAASLRPYVLRDKDK